MAYRAPNAFTRKVFNPLAMRLRVAGTVPLAVRRRRSGGEQEVPVIVLEHGGARYLVSPRGESDWVRNLRAAAGACRVDGRAETATEVPVAERGPILAAYRKKAGQAVAAHFKALPDDADHPVFRLG
jgi:hypothetical protein